MALDFLNKLPILSALYNGPDSNGDFDWIPGVSVAGGSRSPKQGAWIGKTVSNTSDTPTPVKTQAQNTINTPNPTYNATTAARAAQATQDAQNRQYTIGNIDNEINRINSAMGNLDSTKRAGLTQLDDQYNKGLSRLNEQQSAALSKYTQKTADTKRDFARSTEDIGVNANNKYRAIMNLLGRSGSGRSSVADNVLPYAVSKDASKSRGEVADSYALNRRDLRDAEDETNTSYKNNVADLGDQRRNKQAALESDIEGKRSGYNNTLASLRGQRAQAAGGSWQQAQNAMQSNISARDSIDRALANLLDNYRNAYTVKDVTVKDPTLKNYSQDLQGVDVNDTNGTGYDTDTSADYLANLKKDEDKKKAAGVTA